MEGEGDRVCVFLLWRIKNAQRGKLQYCEYQGQRLISFFVNLQISVFFFDIHKIQPISESFALTKDPIITQDIQKRGLSRKSKVSTVDIEIQLWYWYV